MTRKRKCNHCEKGFKTNDLGELRRCMQCNPPLMNFGFYIVPAEGVDPEDVMPDETKAIAAEGIAEYMTAIIEFHDKQELGII